METRGEQLSKHWKSYAAFEAVGESRIDALARAAACFAVMPDLDSADQLKQRAVRIAALVCGILLAGTLGYRFISHGQSSWVDCLYMVVITVSTIGYGEVVPLDNHPFGRIFTMFVALSGIGIITYAMGTVTQAAVDGDLQQRWRRRKMQKAIGEMSGHYLVCGWSDLAPQITRELQQTQRPFVVVIEDRALWEKHLDGEQWPMVVEGDPTDDDVLRRAGIERCAGVFAVDDSDHTNIVVCMSAHGLKADAKIVASVREENAASKMKKAGASSVVSPTKIGALRMSSEMVRPSVVTFLDVMLRDKDHNLRIEDIRVGSSGAGRTISMLQMNQFESSVLLASRRGDDWIFKPLPDYVLQEGDILVFMTNPEERKKLGLLLG